MTVISLQEYAKQKNVSYEAVRKQVARYKEELKGHIRKDGRQQFLDEEAVAFLDERRQKNPVVIQQQGKDEQIEELENQVKQLLVKTTAQADRISELSQWKAENALLIAGAEQNRLALEAAEKEKKILEGFIQDAKAEIATLAEEKEKEVSEARQEATEARLRADELEGKVKTLEEERTALKAKEEQLEELKHMSLLKRLFWKG